MKYNLLEWHHNFERFAENCRKSKPIPVRKSLSTVQLMQHQIIKGSLLLRLKSLSALKSSQNSLHGISHPNIVITSNGTGLAAANDIKQEKKLSLFCLYPGELNGFLRLFPDPGYKNHIHIWSHFLEGLEDQATQREKQYPLNNTEKYWLHVEGLMCGSFLGRGSEHLWSWGGRRAKLLKKNFRQWVF